MTMLPLWLLVRLFFHSSEDITSRDVSPDGAYWASGSIVRVSIGLGPHAHDVMTVGSVRIHSAQPEDTFRVFIGSLFTTLNHLDSIDFAPQIKFSPDSRRLAILSRGRLSTTQLQTRVVDAMTLPTEHVTSFAWRDVSRIVYVAASAPGFFEYSLDSVPGERARFQTRVPEEVPCQETGCPQVSWSPNGRFALFVARDAGKRILLIDFDASEIYDYGLSNATRWTVAWKDDSSAVFCVTYLDGRGIPEIAYFVQLPSGEAEDLTEQLVRLDTSIGLLENWTADQEYLIINTQTEGYLVKPSPWLVVAASDAVRRRLDAAGEKGVASRNRSCRLQGFPVPGWLIVQIGIGSWLYDYRSGDFLPFTANSAIQTATGLVCEPRAGCVNLPEELRKAQSR